MVRIQQQPCAVQLLTQRATLPQHSHCTTTGSEYLSMINVSIWSQWCNTMMGVPQPDNHTRAWLLHHRRTTEPQYDYLTAAWTLYHYMIASPRHDDSITTVQDLCTVFTSMIFHHNTTQQSRIIVRQHDHCTVLQHVRCSANVNMIIVPQYDHSNTAWSLYYKMTAIQHMSIWSQRQVKSLWHSMIFVPENKDSSNHHVITGQLLEYNCTVCSHDGSDG